MRVHKFDLPGCARKRGQVQQLYEKRCQVAASDGGNATAQLVTFSQFLREKLQSRRKVAQARFGL